VPQARNILVQLRVWGNCRTAANHISIDANSVRSLCLDRRDGARGEAGDRNSSIVHLVVVGSRPVMDVMLTFVMHEWPDDCEQTAPCRIGILPRVLLSIGSYRLLPPPVRFAVLTAPMHHGMKQHPVRPIVDSDTLP
jgi:hypothetical protein